MSYVYSPLLHNIMLTRPLAPTPSAAPTPLVAPVGALPNGAVANGSDGEVPKIMLKEARRWSGS